MDHEFHYYMTYLIAVRAGVGVGFAGVLAYSSQYVDDNTEHMAIDNGKATAYTNIITQTMNILKPKPELGKIYPLFHFIPGDGAAQVSTRADGHIHPLITTADSSLANAIIDAAFTSQNPYLMGIAGHAYVDTWAHQNFVGFLDGCNGFNGLPEAFIPDIGHADAGHSPDRVAHIWRDPRLAAGMGSINNNIRFMEAARSLFYKLKRFVEPTIDQELLEQEGRRLVADLVHAMGVRDDANQKQSVRISAYQTLGMEPEYGNQPVPSYESQQWLKEAIKIEYVPSKKDDGSQGPLVPTYHWRDAASYQQSNWYLFQEASKIYQQLAWDIINEKVDLEQFIADQMAVS